VVAVVTGYSYADVVERLFCEFGDRFSLATIVGVVHECREQLSGVAESAMDEMLERLARQRLNSTPQRSHSATPEQTIAPLHHRPDAGWVPTAPDAPGAGVASAKFRTGYGGQPG
jgi:hypothetical protein